MILSPGSPACPVGAAGAGYTVAGQVHSLSFVEGPAATRVAWQAQYSPGFSFETVEFFVFVDGAFFCRTKAFEVIVPTFDKRNAVNIEVYCFPGGEWCSKWPYAEGIEDRARLAWGDVSDAASVSVTHARTEAGLATGDVIFETTDTTQTGFTTASLANGGHWFRVSITNGAGTVTNSEAVSVTVYSPPEAPTIDSAVLAGGTLTLTVTAPADAAMAFLRVYQSASWSGGGLIPNPRQVLPITASEEVEVTITDLAPEAVNRIAVSVMNESGVESPMEFWVGDLNEGLDIVGPAPEDPVKITAVQDGEDVLVSVWVLPDCETVHLYSDGGTGTVDYVTAIDSETNPEEVPVQEIQFTVEDVDTGTYIFAAKSEADDILSDPITVTVSVYREALAAPTLTVEAVR